MQLYLILPQMSKSSKQNQRKSKLAEESLKVIRNWLVLVNFQYMNLDVYLWIDHPVNWKESIQILKIGNISRKQSLNWILNWRDMQGNGHLEVSICCKDYILWQPKSVWSPSFLKISSLLKLRTGIRMSLRVTFTHVVMSPPGPAAPTWAPGAR